MIREATAYIHLDNICHNLQVARNAAPASRVMAVVKGDAYGHGAIEVAKALESQVDSFAVARLREAAELRRAGVTVPICLLEGVLDHHELQIAMALDLQLVIHGRHQIPMLGQHKSLRLWIKIDTGMGRLGFRPGEFDEISTRLENHCIEGVMTHLSSADEPDPVHTENQVQQLTEIASEVPLSISNSGGILNQSVNADWVRPGLLLYGASPRADMQPDARLKAGMTLVAPVIAVRTISAGQTVGYGRTWRAESDCQVAVVAVGYADGYPREIAEATPVNTKSGKRLIVGRVSMDMISVLLRAEDKLQVGDPVTLWGEALPIEDIASAADTIPYTLMTGVTRRVARVYEGAST